jgi:hypothetical protein
VPKLLWLIVMLVVLVIAVVMAGGWIAEQARIDRCLDGGGRWLSSESRCER